MTPTDHHHRTATLVLTGMIVFVVGAPLVIGLQNENGPGLPAISPLIAWGMNLWVFGWARLHRAALILSMRIQTDPNRADGYLMARALQAGHIDTKFPVHALITTTHPLDAPPVMAAVLEGSSPGGELHTYHLTDQENAGLAHVLAQGQSAYALAYYTSSNQILTPPPASAHARLELIAQSNAAIAQARPQGPVRPSRASALLGRLFPGWDMLVA